MRFTIAVRRNFKNAKGEYDADFIRCTAWKQTAEFLAAYLTKGMRVGVEGRIQTGSYTAQDGTKKYTFEVVADRVESLQVLKKPDENGFTEVPTDELPF